MKVLPWMLAVVLAAMAGFLYGTSNTPKTTDAVPLEAMLSKAVAATVSVRTDIADLSDPNMRGSGSAFHIGDGVYITAAHVVDGGTKIYLDPRSRTVKHLLGVTEAKLIGKVDEFDLAVLRGAVIPEKLAWAETPALIGSGVYAIGNPFARAPRSVTAGIVSGLDRLQQTPKGALAGLVQFDAQVNPGNSGGALVNNRGQVLGIVSSILSPTGSSAGVGFAISTNLIKSKVEAMLRGEKIVFPSLGVSSQDDGAILQTVQPGGLAAAAGLQAGDEILEIAGLPVETLSEINAVVLVAKSGSNLAIKAKRSGATRDFSLRIP